MTEDRVAKLTPDYVRTLSDEGVGLFVDDRFHLSEAVDSPNFLQNQPLFEQIKMLLQIYPHLSETFDYGWAADPASYRYGSEVMLQYYLLRLIADIDPRHPKLADHVPFVAKVAIGRGFVSSSLNVGDVTVVAISRGFMDFLRYWFELALDLSDLETRLPARESPDETAAFGWGVDRIAEISDHYNGDMNDAFQRFAWQAFKASMETLAEPSPGITPRLLKAPAVQAMGYLSTESYLLAHELGHVLEGHTASRKLHQEVMADLAATSICIASSGTAKHFTDNMHFYCLYSGIPLFFAAGRLYLNVGAAVDRVTGHPPRMDYLEARTEIEARELFAQQSFAKFDIPTEPLAQSWSRIENFRNATSQWIDTIGRTQITE
jgi:hypothetical protein